MIRMFHKDFNKENFKFIYCVPRVEASYQFSTENLMDAITFGTNKHKAIFSYSLYSNENAILLAKSWLSVKSGDYWIIALNQSPEEYLKLRSKFYGDFVEIGPFLSELRDYIVFCKDKNGEISTPTKRSTCILM